LAWDWDSFGSTSDAALCEALGRFEKTLRIRFVFAAEDEIKTEPEAITTKADRHNPNIPNTLDFEVNHGEIFKSFDT
jgi:hypothetical protein